MQRSIHKYIDLVDSFFVTTSNYFDLKHQ